MKSSRLKNTMLFIVHERWIYHAWGVALLFTFSLLLDGSNACNESLFEYKGYADIY